MRAWKGPAMAIDLRPFFLRAGLWAALAMAVWLAMSAGAFTLPARLAAVEWHLHEFIFGYVPATQHRLATLQATGAESR